MTKVLLGGAAGLLAAAGAQAADLPMAEPVQYVKICDTFGAGFFYIPGSDTCLKISGYVRFEYAYVEPDRRTQDTTAFFARGNVQFDARTATDYGTLRSFIALQFDRNTNTPGASSAFANGNPGGALIDKAFIQFGGLTAGYLDSFYDFKPYPTFYQPFVSDISTIALAYTAQFGNGFTATVAAEDNSYRRVSSLSALPKTLTGVVIDPLTGRVIDRIFTFPSVTTSKYAGQAMPDFVGALRVEQGWGVAQLSGAVHQDRSQSVTASGKGDPPNTDYGFAVQGGIKVNLPMWAQGDYIYASGAYAKGAIGYVFQGTGVGDGGNFGLLTGLPFTDFAYTSTGKIKQTDAFNANAGLLHYWGPKWRSGFSFSYVNVNNPTFLNPDIRVGRKNYNADWEAITAGANLIWTPVKNLDIGLEAVYTNVINRPDKFPNSGWNGVNGQYQTWSGRLRIERDF